MKGIIMYKRFLIICCILVFVILGGTATVNIYHDPLFQYSDPFGYENFESNECYYSFQNATYQNPGMVRNFKYNTLITGSSMTQNFDCAYFDELMGVNSLKASLSGANMKNVSSLVKLALDENPDLEKIYVSLDDYALFGDPLAEGNQPPDYLLNDSLFDDLNYILNKDILFTYTLNDFYIKLRYDGKTIPKNEIFMWSGLPYGETKVLGQYVRPEICMDYIFPKDSFYSIAKENLDTYWIPIITNNPDVEFNFFFPPYSMLWWDNYLRSGRSGAIIAMDQYAAEYLIQYDNVNVYLFSGIEPLVGNLWNYKDEGHYHLRINDYMTECFAENKHLLTPENLEQEFSEWSLLIEEYNYEKYFNNELSIINEFFAYIDTIDYHNSIVLLAVEAEFYEQLPSDTQLELIHMGISPSGISADKYYIAIDTPSGIVSEEIFGEYKIYTNITNGHEIVFEQILAENDVLFSIQIDDIEYSQNSRGISFVVFDLQNNRVVDSVSFEGENLVANRLGVWSDLPQYRKYLRHKIEF